MPVIPDSLTESQKLIVIQNAVLEQQGKRDRHHALIVEGINGERPLMERVRNIEAFIDGIKFWQRTIAVAIVLQTLTFGAAALVYFVKLYPLLEKISNQP